jgi:hypothetical protein
MPGALAQVDELDQFAVTADEQMGRDAHLGNLREIGMGRRVQPILEQGLDPGAAEFVRRQADVVDDQQVDGDSSGPFVAVRRRRLPGA